MAGQAPPTSQIICPQHKVTALMDMQGSDMFVSPTETISWPSCLETFPNIWQVQQRINVSVMLKLGIFPGSCKQRAKCACSGDRQNFYLFFSVLFSHQWLIGWCRSLEWILKIWFQFRIIAWKTAWNFSSDSWQQHTNLRSDTQSLLWIWWQRDVGIVFV